MCLFQFAEDAGLKRPLMAPRRTLGRNEISAKIKGRPSCKSLCKPCYYVFGALIVLIGINVFHVKSIRKIHKIVRLEYVHLEILLN